MAGLGINSIYGRTQTFGSAQGNADGGSTGSHIMGEWYDSTHPRGSALPSIGAEATAGVSFAPAPPSGPRPSSGRNARSTRSSRVPRKRAFLVGINYRGDSAPLRGCINDVNKMESILRNVYGLSDDDILVLTEDMPRSRHPTKSNILAGFDWLVKGAVEGDVLFCHYSGHGTQVPDRTGTETDRMSEALVPLDHNNCRNLVKDVEVTAHLFDRVPDGVILTAVMDCCHSGTMVNDLDIDTSGGTRNIGQAQDEAKVAKKLGLPPNARSRHFVPPPEVLARAEAAPVEVSSSKPAHRAFTTEEGVAHEKNPDACVFLFSGCRDHQTSADAYIDNTYQGAFTWGLSTTLEESGYRLTYGDLMHGAQNKLKRSQYSQDPLLSTEERQYLDLPFMEPISKEVIGQQGPGGPAAPAASSSSGGGGGAGPSSPSPPPSQKPQIGIYVDDARYYGVLITHVKDGSRGEAAGLTKGDVIEEVCGSPVADTAAFKQCLSAALRSTTTLPFRVRRTTASGYQRSYNLVVDLSVDSGGSGASGAGGASGESGSNNASGSGGYPDVTTLRPFVGMRVADDHSEAGVIVTTVNPGEPAGDSGIRERDVITSIALRPVPTTGDYALVMREVAKVGVILPMTVTRGGRYGQSVTINVPVGGR